MSERIEYLFFSVDQHRFAIPLSHVRKVLQVVEMQTVPYMPKFLHGIINYFGKVRPVVNMHYLFSYPKEEIQLSDQLIAVSTNKRKLLLLVDAIHEVKEIPKENIKHYDPVVSNKQYVKGAIKLEDGMVLINDVKQFLDASEMKELEAALDQVSIQEAKS